MRHKGVHLRHKGVHQKVDLGAAGESLRHKAMRSEILRHKGVALNNAWSVTSNDEPGEAKDLPLSSNC